MNNTEIIDLKGDCSNSSLSNYPLALEGATGVFINNMVILCGGSKSASLEDLTDECYKLSKGNTFDFLCSMHDNRATASAISTNGKMWVTGGWSLVGLTRLKTTEVIHPQNSASNSTIPININLPEAITGHVIIGLNNARSLLIGGNTLEERYSNKTYFINHMTHNWTRGPDLKKGRHQHTAGVIKDHKTAKKYIVVVGGFGDDGRLDSTEINYNEGNGWEIGICFIKHFCNI